MTAAMTSRKPSNGGQKTREQRLAEALRANLRRRKAASRALGESDADRGDSPQTTDSPDESKPASRRP
jgi:hypothetical protein